MQVVIPVGGNRTEVFRFLFPELGKRLRESSVAGCGLEGKEGDHQASDQEAEAVEGVGNRDRAQSSEDRVGGSHHSDEDHNRPDGPHLAKSEHLFEVQHSIETFRAQKEDEGQEDQHVGDDEDEGREGPGGWSVAFLEELGDSRDPGLEVAWQEEESEDHKGSASDHLPCHDGQAVCVGVAVQSDQLFGREIGQEKGPRDDEAGQAAPCEEVALFGVVDAAPGETPGEKGNQGREEEEGDDCGGVHLGEGSGLGGIRETRDRD